MRTDKQIEANPSRPPHPKRSRSKSKPNPNSPPHPKRPRSNPKPNSNPPPRPKGPAAKRSQTPTRRHAQKALRQIEAKADPNPPRSPNPTPCEPPFASPPEMPSQILRISPNHLQPLETPALIRPQTPAKPSRSTKNGRRYATPGLRKRTRLKVRVLRFGAIHGRCRSWGGRAVGASDAPPVRCR